MQDSFLRLLGFVGIGAGLLVFFDGDTRVGLGLAILAVVAILASSRLPFRQFGAWRPGRTSLGSARDQRRRRHDADQRMRHATARGPGGRRGDVVDLGSRDQNHR